MRKVMFTGALIAVAAIAWGIWSVSRGSHDYRDPIQLANAIKAKEHATGANCGKLPGGKYLCVAANADGSSGTYTVTVSADGHSYTTG